MKRLVAKRVKGDEESTRRLDGSTNNENATPGS